jgi:hypothetical protein
MTGEHFKELVETVCMTFKVSKFYVYKHLLLSQAQYNYYEREGLPPRTKVLIMNRLRKFYLDRL